MARTLVLGDILKVQLVCSRGVQTSLNSVYYQVTATSGVTPTDADTAASFDLAVHSLVRNMITNSAHYLGMLVQKVFPLPVTAHVFGTANAGAGNTFNNPAPDEICGLISARTALAGRAFRGRIYTPFLDLAFIDSGAIDVTSPYVALMGALGAVLYDPYTVNPGPGTATLTPGVFHRKANKAGTTAPNTITPITGYVLELLYATQRRRGARGKANLPPV